MIDLALLDGVGTALAYCHIPYIFPSVRNWYLKWPRSAISLTDPRFGIGFKMIDVLQRRVNATDYQLGVNLYSCLILATTLWCTFFIIYRILTVGWTSHGGIRIYRHVIEILVESSVLYSASLILYLGLFAHDSSNSALIYWDSVAAFARVSKYACVSLTSNRHVL